MSIGSTGTGERTWWQNAVFYELYVDKFAGDFPGLTARLDYLADLGVTCVHVLPHYPSPMVDDGYDVSDYRGVRPELGTLEDFKRFVDEAHRKGIRVLLDFVLNHVSEEHAWFREARASKDNDKRGFFIWSDDNTKLQTATNVFPEAKPSNWIWNEATQDFYFATFYGAQPDLNWDEPRVFEEMTANIDFWIDLGVDAFRLDAAPFLIKREGRPSVHLPETHAVLKKIREHLNTKNEDVALLAEVHATLEETMAYFGDGDECHIVYGFPFMEGLYAALCAEDRALLEFLTQHYSTLPKACAWAPFLSNHDGTYFQLLPDHTVERVMAVLDPARERFFGSGTSCRLASLFEGDRDKLVAAHELLFSCPGSPVIYYGDEIGMKNEPIPESEVDKRRVMRGAFDWEETERQAGDPSSALERTRVLVRARRRRIKAD